MLLQELSQLSAAGSLSPPDSRQSGEAAGSGPAAAAAARKKKKKAVPAGNAVATGAAPSPPAGSEGAAAAPGKPAAAAGSKRGRLDWTDDDSDADQPPAAPQLRTRAAAQHQDHAQVSAPAALAGAGGAASPPSIGGAPAGGGGSSGGGVRRTSSNRGSQQADESWIEELADRQPEPAAPITSREVGFGMCVAVAVAGSAWHAGQHLRLRDATCPGSACPCASHSPQPFPWRTCAGLCRTGGRVRCQVQGEPVHAYKRLQAAAASGCLLGWVPAPPGKHYVRRGLLPTCTPTCSCLPRSGLISPPFQLSPALPQVYFDLHQLIQAHKKDFEALAAAVAEAPSPTERER